MAEAHRKARDFTAYKNRNEGIRDWLNGRTDRENQKNRSNNPTSYGPRMQLYMLAVKYFPNHVENNKKGKEAEVALKEFAKQHPEEAEALANYFKEKNHNVAHLVNGWLGIQSDNNKSEEKGDEVR